MKRVIALLLAAMMSCTVFTGCGKAEETAGGTEAAAGETKETGKPYKLTLMVYGNVNQFFTEHKEIMDAYKEVEPNATIELEIFKDPDEMEKALKIRKTADEMPNIIPLKPYQLEKFKDDMMDLTGSDVANNNIYAGDFAIDGKVLGIPMASFYEFVYYNKAIFEEYKMTPPKTWEEFQTCITTIKDGEKYVPVGMGAKDSWPVYPFNEFIPMLYTGDGALFDTMGSNPDAFSIEGDFAKSYLEIEEFFAIEPFGKDPLGVSWEQAKAQFAAGDSAMYAAGQWFYAEVEAAGCDMSNVGAFLLPYKEKESDTLKTIGMVDNFLGVAKNAENADKAKEFVEWFFASEYYKTFVEEQVVVPTVKGMEIDTPWLNDALSMHEVEFVNVAAEGAAAHDFRNKTQFDPKRFGQEMLSGKSVADLMKENDEKWKSAQ